VDISDVIAKEGWWMMGSHEKRHQKNVGPLNRGGI
jgi:hypothetical protein